MSHLGLKQDLSHAVIMLHPRCNMTCSFCVTEDSFDAMTPDEGIRFLGFLKEAGVRSVIFGGGEPFTWKYDLLDLTRQAKGMGFQVQVGTNGINLPAHFTTIESIDRYILPLDSVEASIHNGMRFYKNRHQSIILERMAALKEAGKEVTLSTVITKKNLSSLKETARYLSEYHSSGGAIHAWHLYQFIPEGRGGAVNAHALSMSPEAYIQACSEIKEMALDFTVFKRSNMYQSKTVGFFWRKEGRWCVAGKSSIVSRISNSRFYHQDTLVCL